MNMMSDEPTTAEIRPVVTNSEALPEKPKVRWYHHVHYYVYNLARKPMVWRKHRELMRLSDEVQYALRRDVYPELLKKAQACEMCSESFSALKAQTFLSQVEVVLKRKKCSSHHRIFENFLLVHSPKFRQSEEVSAWINGFK